MQNLIYKTGRGTDITQAANDAVSLAKKQQKNILFMYNNIMMNVDRYSTTRGVINRFFSQTINERVKF